MQRFYIKEIKLGEENFELSEKEIVHQLVKVLRVKNGEEIIIFNGESLVDYVYKINDITKKTIELIFVEKIIKNSENTLSMSLIQALPNKLEKIEYIVQKGTEIGLKEFIIYRSERSQKDYLSDKKIDRLEKIIIEAVEQCGGNVIPRLQVIDGNIDLSNYKYKNNIFCHTSNDDSYSIKEYSKKINGLDDVLVNIFIGPEGGFSDSEIEKFEENGFDRIHFGNRVLRTETAGICLGFSLLQML